eukprot:gene9754-6841_t
MPDATAGGAVPLRRIDLFGGAMALQVPAAFRDVSDYFPIPDTQEVYQDPTSPDTVFTVELLERADEVDNAAAGPFYLDDAVKAERSATAELIQCEPIEPDTACPLLLNAVRRTGTAATLVCDFACRVEGRRHVPPAKKKAVEDGTSSTKEGAKKMPEKKEEAEEAVAPARVLLAVLRLSPPVHSDVILTLVVPEAHPLLGKTNPAAADTLFTQALHSFQLLDMGLFCLLVNFDITRAGTLLATVAFAVERWTKTCSRMPLFHHHFFFFVYVPFFSLWLFICLLFIFKKVFSVEKEQHSSSCLSFLISLYFTRLRVWSYFKTAFRAHPVGFYVFLRISP